MRYSLLMAYVMLPIITMCSSNTYSMEEEAPVNARVNNNDVLEVQDVLGKGYKISPEYNKYYTHLDDEYYSGEFIVYFAPKRNKNGIITVNCWHDNGTQDVIVKNGEFFLSKNGIEKQYADKNKFEKYCIVAHKTTEYTSHQQQTPKGVKQKHKIKHPTKYYLATYDQQKQYMDAGHSFGFTPSDEEIINYHGSLTTTPVSLLDAENIPYFIGLANSPELKNPKITRKFGQVVSVKAKYTACKTYKDFGRKISAGIFTEDNDMMVKLRYDTEFLRALINLWSKNHDSKYIEKLKDRYGIINYFGDTSQEAFEELLNDIYEYYQLRDKEEESKK